MTPMDHFALSSGKTSLPSASRTMNRLQDRPKSARRCFRYCDTCTQNRHANLPSCHGRFPTPANDFTCLNPFSCAITTAT